MNTFTQKKLALTTLLTAALHSVVDVDTGSYGELSVLEEGEYKVAIRSAAVQENKAKDGENLVLRLEVVDHDKADEADDIYVYIGLPNGNVEDKKKNIKKAQRLGAFKAALGLGASDPLDLDAIVDETVWANLGVEKDNQDEDRNYLKSFVAKR